MSTPPGTSALWFNPAVGVAGDMVLAALIDAGADPNVVRTTIDAAVEGAGLPSWSLEVSSTARRGLGATSVTVTTTEHDRHRSWSTIDRLLASAELPSIVSEGARTTFQRLAVAEAEVHGIDVDRVHFHEIGAVDAIVDVVGAWAALHDIGAPSVTSGPVGLGVGTADMAHGTVAVPAPATLELLRDVPTAPVDVTGETATPTGVALLVTMASGWGPPPGGIVVGNGRGAGSWDPPGHANVLTVVRFRNATATPEALVLETNLDDVTPEVIGHVIDRAIACGADDAWCVPVTMKKSRPGHQLRILCSSAVAPVVRDLITTETATLGFREWPVTKHELPRHVVDVEVDGHPIRIKVGPFGAKPEHDDVVAAALALDMPVRKVASQAMARFDADR